MHLCTLAVLEFAFCHQAHMLAPHSFCLPDDTFRLPGNSIRAKHASYSCACDLGEMLMGSSEFFRTLQSRVTVQATATSKDCCIWFCFPSSDLNMVAGRSSLWILYHFLRPVNSWLPLFDLHAQPNMWKTRAAGLSNVRM